MVEIEVMNETLKLDDLDQNSRAILEGVVRCVTSGPGRLAEHSVIDVGCGEGRLLARLAELGAGELTGVGWKVTVPADTKKVEGIDVCRAGWATQFEGHVFDWVVSTEVLEHLVNPFQYLVELRRLVAPHGRVVLTFPNVHNLRSIIGYAVGGRFSGFFGPNFNANHPLFDQHIFIPNLHLVRYLMRVAGLSLVEVHPLNGSHRLLAQTTMVVAAPCDPVPLP